MSFRRDREPAFGRGMLATVLVGFARSFFLRPLFPEWHSPSETIFYVHGAAFTAWIVLLVAQTSMVAGGRTDLHRRIGPFGVALAAAMVVLGAVGAIIAARRPTGFTDVPIPPLQFLAIPIFDVVLFASFVALAAVMIALGSLRACGFASGATPEIGSLTPLKMAAPAISSREV